jgi:hypothetical protein
MEKLFNIPAVYPYLMERYSSSGRCGGGAGGGLPEMRTED